MKNVISMLLLCAMIAPVYAQKTRVDHVRKHAATKKVDCDVKDCKCSCHRKDQKRATSRSHKRGGKVIRNRNSRSNRGSKSRKGAATERSDSKKMQRAVRKNWVEATKKRVDKASKKQDAAWRKRIEAMRKTLQHQPPFPNVRILRDGRLIARTKEARI